MGLQAVAELGHRGERGGGQRDRAKTTVGLAVPNLAGMDDLPGREDGAPGAQHFFGVVEAVPVVAPERLGEEGGEALARDRVENIALDTGFDSEHRRRRMAVAPNGGLAHRHLVQGDGERKPLGVQIPTRRPAHRQKGIEVGVSASRDVVGRRAAKRKVEQHKLQLACAVFGDADVFGLDVAVGHPF